MRFSLPVARMFGTQVRVHGTLFLMFGWVLLDEALEETWSAAFRSVETLVLIFSSVLLHEFGHVLAARRYGISTPEITLMPIGGVARLEKVPEVPSEEILVALAGPAVSALTGASLWAASGFENVFAETPDHHSGNLLAILSAVNFSLLIFNLLPAFPMDGGRVLRACLALRFPYAKATEWASQTGKLIAGLLFVLGLTLPMPMLSILAVFIYLSAARENAMTARRMLQEGRMPAAGGPTGDAEKSG